MYQTVLFVLCVSVIPVLGTEQCLCADSDVVIRKLPSPTAPVTGKLATGSCLNVSQFERTGQWLKIVRNGIQTGYLLESDGVHQRNCQDHRSVHSTLYCELECPAECCGVHSSSSAHHHGVHCGPHCDRHNCCDQVPIWSQWGHCSVTCGVGIRHRHCTHHCSSLNSTQESQACHQSACPVVNHVSDHSCDKVSVVQAVALQVTENCSDHFFQSFTPFVIQHCSAPTSLVNWVPGSKVSTSCNTLPMYSPVATLHQHSHQEIIAGVFAGCVTNDEFKIIASPCGASPQVMHISTKNATFNHFYQVKW